MLSSLSKTSAFVSRQGRTMATRAFSRSQLQFAKEGQAEVILVGCGQPNKGMGWYRK